MKEVPSEQTTAHFLLHARRLISGVGGLPDFGFWAFFRFQETAFFLIFYGGTILWWYHLMVVSWKGGIIERFPFKVVFGVKLWKSVLLTYFCS